MLMKILPSSQAAERYRSNMLFRLSVFFALLGAAKGLAPPTSNAAAPSLSQCIGTACLAAALSFGDPAVAYNLGSREHTMNAGASSSVIVRSASVQQQLSSTTTLASQAPFWDQPFVLLPDYQLTNQNVAGGLALTLGAAYGLSFAYYQYSIAEEEAEAQRKKEAMAAKRKAAAATKKVALETTERDLSTKEPLAVAAAVATVVVPGMSSDEKLDVEKARAAVEKAKKFDFAARTAEKNREVKERMEEIEEDDIEVEDFEVEDEMLEPTRMSKRLRFWRWLRRSEA